MTDLSRFARRLRRDPEGRMVIRSASNDTVLEGAKLAKGLSLSRLNRRTGRLSESIRAETGEGHRPAVVGGEKVWYFRTHEEGATLVATSKLLAVPLPGTTVRSPRQVPDSKFIPKPYGGVVLDAGGVARFVLLHKLEVPAKRMLRDGLESAAERYHEHFEKHLAQHLGAA